jgi:hypothetical protein
MTRAWTVVVMLLATACQKDAPASAPGPARPALGKERGDCKPEKVCDPGLLCLSNLCVRPPPADCQQVADILASFELGNYAEVEVREPVVARYKASCEKVYVSKEQGECFAKATDKAAAELCAPAMFATQKVEVEAGSGSDVKIGGGGDCTTIAEKIRGQMGKQMGNADPQTQQMFAKVITIVRESCEQDGWPPAFKSCVISAGDNTDAMNKCSKDMPPALQQKMTERMAKAMQPGP